LVRILLLIHKSEVADFTDLTEKNCLLKRNSPTWRYPLVRHGLAIEYNTAREDGG
jgi:hypothetical protein